MTRDGAPVTAGLRRLLRWAAEAIAAKGDDCVDQRQQKVPEGSAIMQDRPRLRAKWQAETTALEGLAGQSRGPPT